MILNCYCVENCRSGISAGLWTYRTDSQAIYEISHLISNTDVGKDISNDKLYCVGTFDNETRELTVCKPRELSLDTNISPIVEANND